MWTLLASKPPAVYSDSMRPHLLGFAACPLLLLSTGARAQTDSAVSPANNRTSARAWIIPIGIAASAALDPEAREWAVRQHSRSLDRLARAGNELGTAQRLVPAIAITYVAALLTHHDSLATGTLNTAGGYIASDLVESVLKPVVGRERPHVEGNSHRFRPFTSSGDWHSFPSAHVAHIASIAEAVSEQTHSTPISAVCETLVALVAWDRVYEDQHWTSDVTGTMVISSAVSGSAVRWLESHWSH
jgi:membrane-associated phospholipid phosphatase